MIKTDKILRKYVTALMKYYEDSNFINPDFTTQQIPEIFSGWTEIDFNKVHHGAGVGCCIYIGSERYKIIIDHCNGLQSKFKDSDRTKLRLIIAAASTIVAIIGLTFVILNYTVKSPEVKTIIITK